jgi:Uma2 family endonuclease
MGGPETRGGDATIDDLSREPGKAELVNGRIVRMPAAGGFHGYATGEIVASLREHARRTSVGYAIPDNVGFVVNLPHRKSFSPDAAYHIGALTMEFIAGAPVFAVEIRSPGDYGPAAERTLAAKRADYFAAGTQVVWDVDLLGDDVVKVYRAGDPDEPRLYRRGEHAAAEPAVPGWSMPVDALSP